jgi:signal transduction histidine kinase
VVSRHGGEGELSSPEALLARILKQVPQPCDGETLFVEIQDDGIGGASLETGGTGLKGMADRATVFGGRLTISCPARGRICVGAAFPVAATPSQISAWYGQQ